MNSDKLPTTSHVSRHHQSSTARCASPYDDDPVAARQEAPQFSYFLRVARSICTGLSESDLQEIAQDSWHSYLRRIEHGDIDRPAAYIKMIVRNKFRDYLRKEKGRASPSIIYLSAFTEHPDFELMACTNQDLINPINELDDRVEQLDFLAKLVIVLLEISSRQRRVIICTLLEKADDPVPIKQFLKQNHIDGSEMDWPPDKTEKQLLQASLPAARRNLAIKMGIDLTQFKQRSHRPRPSMLQKENYHLCNEAEAEYGKSMASGM